MRSRPVVVIEVLLERPPQVPFVQDDQVVEALLPECSAQILIGAADGLQRASSAFP